MRVRLDDGGDGIVCDRCGADLGNGSVYDAVSIVGIDEAGEPFTVHLGMPVRCGCATRVITRKAIAWRADNGPGALTWHNPDVAVG